MLSFFAGFRYIKDMIGKIMDYIKEYEMIQENDVVIAGVSGGADSVCLLFVLLEIQKKMPFQIRVVHVDHGIRKEAGRDAAFVEQLCRENKLSFYLERADVPALSKSSGLSVEEEGRRVRYQAFEKALGKDTGKIAVAHNSNDRAETMLFHLFRGTGLRGMSGIRPVNGRVIRPLLCVSRQEIEAWLTQKGLSYCEDSTNSEDVYTRNRIRHHILPYAQQQICQGAVGNMNRAAQELFLANEFVERKTREALSECVREQAKDRICVQLPLFLKQDPYLKGRILLSLLSQLHGSQKNITSAHVESIRRLFEGKKNGRLDLPYGITVYKSYDEGMLQKDDKGVKQGFEEEAGKKEYPVSIPGTVYLPGAGTVEFTVFSRDNSQNIPEKTYTKWFDYDKIASTVVFRTRQQGDYLTVNKALNHKSIQDYFVNEKIPAKERDHLFLLAEKSHIIWVLGRRISEYYKVRENTKRVLQVKVAGAEE